MDPQPKMQILNRKEYLEKFDQGISSLIVALANSMSDQHEKALTLLLELKRKRWVNFQLFHQITQEYVALGRYDEAREQIKLLNPQNDEQKQELLQLENLIKGATMFQKIDELKQQLNTQPDQRIFEKTQKIPTKEMIDEAIVRSTVNEFNSPNQWVDVSSMVKFKEIQLHNNGLFNQFRVLVQHIYGESLKNIIFQQEDDQLLMAILFSATQQYQIVLSLLSRLKKNYETLFYQGFCNLQLKQYKEAFNLFQQSFKLNQTVHTKEKIYFLNSIFGKPEVKLADQLGQEYKLCLQISYFKYSSYFKQKISKQIQFPIRINELQNEIYSKQNSLMFLYPELFWLRYELNRQDPMLQQICDFLIENAYLYAGGYSCQCALYMDQNKKDQLNTLVQPLQSCDESTLKYVTLAKIYQEQSEYDKAHQTLGNAMQINKYEEEIYLLQIELYHKQQNYRMAYQSKRELVQLERENFAFVNELIFDLLGNYEYYRAIDLLSLADQESEALQELQILVNIISLTHIKESDQLINLLNSIQSLQSPKKLLFQGHYWLRLNKISEALEFYNFTQVKDQVEQNLIQIGISSINQKQQLNEYQRIDIICQMSSYNAKYEPHPTKMFNRYRDTLAYVLSSLVFNQRTQQISEYINTHYDMEVPALPDLKVILLHNIQLIYRKEYIKLETYNGYMEQSLQQLQKLFQNEEYFLDAFFKLCSKQEQDITESIIKNDHQTYEQDDDLKILYQIPFFFDPISRYALFRVVKMIGYFCENEQVNNYMKMEEWTEYYLLAPHIDKYFNVVVQQRFTKPN